jgi:hypothetical protein
LGFSKRRVRRVYKRTSCGDHFFFPPFVLKLKT